MFDVNPDPQGEVLSLNVNPDSNLIDIDLAIESGEYYGLSFEQCRQLAADICLTVRENWERVAKRCHVSQNSIEGMRPAFIASKWEA